MQWSTAWRCKQTTKLRSQIREIQSQGMKIRETIQLWWWDEGTWGKFSRGEKLKKTKYYHYSHRHYWFKCSGFKSIKYHQCFNWCCSCITQLHLWCIENRNIPSWWSSKLRCWRVSAEGFDRQAKEQGVTRPSMKLQDNHLSCLLLDNNSMNNCWILPEAKENGNEEREEEN